MKITLLDSSTLGEGVDLSVFSQFGQTEIFGTSSPDSVKNRLIDTDVAVINKVKLNGTNLLGTKVKLICIAATGSDNVDVAYCKDHGIAVCNVAGYSTNSVAQVTLSLVLTLMTHFEEYTSFVKDGSYSASGIANKLSPAYNELYGKTWGIVGYGNIGKQVGKIAEAFGCKLLVYRKHADKGGNCVDLDTLCRESDIITLHTPLNDGTKSLISKENISVMKQTAVIVNTSRGGVWDENAIAEAVLSKKLAGMGSDVYTSEPFTESHPFYALRNLPNVCLTPHMAWGSVEARKKLICEMAENIKSFINGGTKSRIDL